METDILNNIKAIRKLLEQERRNELIIIVLVVVVALSLIIYDNFFNKSFYKKANDLFEQANYEELVELLNKKQQTEPNEEYIYYYHARMALLKGDTASARKNLDHLKLLAPNWDQDYIKPMLESAEKIDAHKDQQ